MKDSSSQLKVSAENRERLYWISNEWFMIWSRAVNGQLFKLAETDHREERALTEFALLVVALNSLDLMLLRKIEILESWSKDEPFLQPSLRHLVRARTAFLRTVPHQKTIRDVFMHIDEYAFGLGRLQRKNKASQEFSVQPSRYKGKHVVVCAGQRLVFDVPKAEQALRRLELAIIDVWVDVDEVRDPEAGEHKHPAR